ncbi:MAG: quinone-dependent dihydroorotate dehydrogenase [Chitinophagales bacterium]
MYKLIIRPVLFLFASERAHYLALGLLKFTLKLPFAKSIFNSLYQPKQNHLSKEVFGLTFKNPIGLAAGFDKNAAYYNELSHLGFGFIEVGTVTPKPQDGNPKPRLFRLVEDEALINRMGFNNDGLEEMIKHLKNRKTDLIIGGNIGKNKVTPNENAIDDYVISFKALHPFVDYFVVNVSSPNTPNLRALQDKEPLTKLLTTLRTLNETFDYPKPILLKIAPDLTEGQLDDIIGIVQSIGIDGIVATNTTISREGLTTSKEKVEAIGNGGLSGKPVRARSTEVIQYITKNTGGKLPIIAVGGIFTAKDAQEKLDAGASLVQVYSGFIYEGPGMVKKICEGITPLK